MTPNDYNGQEWLWDACSSDEAVALIKSGQRIFLHGGCAVSLPLEKALARRAMDLEDLRILQLHKDGEEPMADPALDGHARIQALFCGSGIRQAVAEGRADYVPVFLSDVPHLMRSGTLGVDVAIVQLSYPDAHGYCSLGTSVDVARQAVESADLVIAEINWRMPRTHGNSFLHINDLDAFVVTDRPLLERPPALIGPTAKQIGHHIADLVSDGATIQVGIGAIPDAALSCMHGKQDLGVHTEMFSDGLVDLVRAGVITNRHKKLHTGSIVTSFVVGTRKVYDFVHDNPRVEFHPSDYTNDTALIRQHDRMVAINGALQVDLTGQVCADSIGSRIYSGIGGQMDFIRGAALSMGGKAIIALPSTAKDGTLSRIVPALSPGAGVVTTRGHVQYVVTEYGVAELHGRSMRERAEALIAIAHPDHRADLRAQLVGRHSVAVGWH